MRKTLNAVENAGFYLCIFTDYICIRYVYIPENTQMFMGVKKRLCWDWCIHIHLSGGQDQGWHSKGAIKPGFPKPPDLCLGTEKQQEEVKWP